MGAWAGGGAGGGLPGAGSVGQTIVNSGPGAGGWVGPPNELSASVLVNAKSVGDPTGGQSDHFLGSALTGWTQEDSAPSAGPVVGNSSFGFVAPSGQTTSYAKLWTPTGLCTVEGRMGAPLNTGANPAATLTVKDASVGSSAEDSVLAQINADTFTFARRDAGAYTSIASVTLPKGMVWGFVRIHRGAAGLWTVSYSLDRAFWTTLSTYTKVFTVGKLKVEAFSDTTFALFDFVDVTL